MEVSLAVKPRGRQDSAGRRLGPGWERQMPVQASRVGLAVFMGMPGMIRLVISVDGKGSPSVVEKIQVHREGHLRVDQVTCTSRDTPVFRRPVRCYPQIMCLLPQLRRQLLHFVSETAS